MVFETSWDDGGTYDMKIVELLKKHKLEKYSTFFIPLNCKIGLEMVKIIAQDFEIGGHTVNHPMDLKQMEGEFVDFEVIHSKGLLESVLDKEITKFCYPRGRFNEYVKERVKEAGWKEARTTRVLHTELDFDVFEKPTTIHCFARNEYQGRDWLELAKEYFLKAKEKDGYFHVWGHSIELQRNNEWGKLDEFLAFAKENL